MENEKFFAEAREWHSSQATVQIVALNPTAGAGSAAGCAVAAGTVAAGATGTYLAGVTAGLAGPTANLGGYATAQIVASQCGLSGSVGGTVLSQAIAALGGPVVAGSVVSCGVGLVVAVLAGAIAAASAKSAKADAAQNLHVMPLFPVVPSSFGHDSGVEPQPHCYKVVTRREYRIDATGHGQFIDTVTLEPV